LGGLIFFQKENSLPEVPGGSGFVELSVSKNNKINFLFSRECLSQLTFIQTYIQLACLHSECFFLKIGNQFS